MIKVIVFMIITAVSYIACYDNVTYDMQYRVDVDGYVEASGTYLTNYGTKEFNVKGYSWESEKITITNDMQYFIMEMTEIDCTGYIYIIVDGVERERSYICPNVKIIFSGVVDMDGDETASVKVDI